ncbi:MAG: hypothetical protein ABWZ42_02105 [Ilumatobacteraceae bacterium]
MTTYELHPGLDPVVRALDRVEPILPVETARARALLAATLAPITQSVWPEISHRLSLLTNSGIPVEFSWSTRHAAVRWTAEVAGPETPKEERLAIAVALAGADVGWLEALQADRHLRFGAWLGARHAAERDELKVYGEIPAGAPAPPVMRHPVFDGLEIEPRIAGVGSNGTIELYGRGALAAAAIDTCERAAFATTGQLRAAVSSLIGTSELPRRTLLSIAIDDDDGVDALTWFGFARTLFPGHDESVAALERWCPDECRMRLLQALAGGADDGRWRVGLIGVRLAADGSTSVQAAIRPS